MTISKLKHEVPDSSLFSHACFPQDIGYILRCDTICTLFPHSFEIFNLRILAFLLNNFTQSSEMWPFFGSHLPGGISFSIFCNPSILYFISSETYISTNFSNKYKGFSKYIKEIFFQC